MMKKILLLSALFFISSYIIGQTKPISVADSAKKIVIAEASCGQCQFGLKSKGCDLAIRIDGKAYFVDGTKIDEHGDAHAKDGFCEMIRKAEVQGEIADGRYKVTYFKLMPIKKPE